VGRRAVGLALFATLILWPPHRRLVLTGLAVVSLLIGGLNFGLAPSARLSQLPYVRWVIVLSQDLHTGTGARTSNPSN